ncbi:MAG: bifunctional tRNA (5-methylaminomethyl-2-thiouridine)(34)-methyltransferase MnmD/FAD-dependent 5-carboxymethylaminomethyl-2-thiouridine(34) oxidoreductase MnmC [Gammaproteobacteria bacterium]|nr:bifunctional tRNA (5-methylaminomethyl-2-thiouridine)(34)-methyltransferase MnmD/FAD-dependent 5-carboxymethylaminomethyl-2-thiouridine(34) oxidoreductase MnmC [Gammaproteobacteria bacterium]
MQFTKIIWRDGQPYSSLFDDIYYSSDDDETVSGESEFNHVFFKHNGLPQRWTSRDDFVIAELGFGSGLNCILTIREWLNHCAASNSRKTLHYIAIEKHPLSPACITELMSRYPELKPYSDELVENYPPAIEATHRRSLFDNRVVIYFKFMDVKDALDDEAAYVDAWYLDGFSPAKNPAMWSAEVFSKLSLNSRGGATCSTYTAAGSVKRNLQQAGFITEKVSGYGKKREMLVARLPAVEAADKDAPLLRYQEKPWFKRPARLDSPAKTATIIGAGIAGLSLAYSLVQRDWSVTIIDKHNEIREAASSNPAPIVYPRLSVNNDIDMAFYTSAYCHALYVLQRLQKTSKRKFWYDDGLLQTFDESRISKILDSFGFNKEYISKSDAADNAGKVMVDYVSAGVVLPAILCDVLRDQCGDKLKMIEADVDEVAFYHGRWHCCSDTASIQKDDVLIVANGSGVNDLGLSPAYPVEIVRGQVVVLNANDASTQIKKTRNDEVHITPAIENKHYLGATYSRENLNAAAEQEDTKELLESLKNIYPDMFKQDDCCEAWVGFRTVSKDRAPIVGAVPDVSFYEKEYADIRHGSKTSVYHSAAYVTGLYISAAHGSRGFTSCFLSAEIVASLIDGSPIPVGKAVLDYLSPSRFIVNDLKRR